MTLITGGHQLSHISRQQVAHMRELTFTHAAPPTEGWHTRVKGLNYVLLHWHQSPVSIPGWRRIVPEPATRDSYAICSVAVLLFFDPLKPFHVIWGAKQILQPACFTSMLSCSSGEPLAFPVQPTSSGLVDWELGKDRAPTWNQGILVLQYSICPFAEGRHLPALHPHQLGGHLPANSLPHPWVLQVSKEILLGN